jgi:hypothetical protein
MHKGDSFYAAVRSNRSVYSCMPAHVCCTIACMLCGLHFASEYIVAVYMVYVSQCATVLALQCLHILHSKHWRNDAQNFVVVVCSKLCF